MAIWFAEIESLISTNTFSRFELFYSYKVTLLVCYFGFFTDSSRFLYTCIIYKMPSFGILLVTFIVWIHSISDANFKAVSCIFGGPGCIYKGDSWGFSDNSVILTAFNSVTFFYVFLIPILTIIGFKADISIPLIVLIVIWIVRTIILKGGSTYQFIRLMYFPPKKTIKKLNE